MGEGLGSEGGTRSSFQNKEQERERLGAEEGRGAQKAGRGQTGFESCLHHLQTGCPGAGISPL